MLYADRVIEYSEFKQINILKKFVSITKGILLRKSQIVNISDEYI